MRLRLLFAVAAALCGAAASAQLLGINFDNGELYRISTTDASRTLVANTGIIGAACLTLAPNGNYYTFTTGPNSTLYKINTTTGAATAVGGLGLQYTFEGAMTFSPQGVAYATNAGEAESPNFFKIDLNTGVATIVSSIGVLPHDINGMVWREDGQLVGIDRETNSLVEFSPNNGSLSYIRTYNAMGGEPNLGEVGGMTRDGPNIYFATGGTDPALPGDNSLWRVDISTGAATRIGGFTGLAGTGISGLAPVPEPATVATLAAAIAFVLLRRRRISEENDDAS